MSARPHADGWAIWNRAVGTVYDFPAMFTDHLFGLPVEHCAGGLVAVGDALLRIKNPDRIAERIEHAQAIV